MGNVLFLVAYLGLPIASFVLVRSLTWIVVALAASIAFVGTFINFSIDRGRLWNLPSLQIALLAALLAVFVAALISRRRSSGLPAVSFVRQLTTVIAPVLIGFGFIIVSRLMAAQDAGLFTGVGFLVVRKSAEDNAKWLDFSAQLVTGHQVQQAVPMGGALQLLVVLAVTLLAVVSLIAFGGVNEIFVAANSIIYLQFALVALVPFVLAPLAEARVRAVKGSAHKGYLPAPVIWIGALVMITGSLAVSGLGHLTLQFVFLTIGLWAAVFIIGTKVPHAYLLTSLAAAMAAFVWFPLTFVTLAILIGAAAQIAYMAFRARGVHQMPWVPAVLWLVTVVLMWTGMISTLRFMTDNPVASGAGGSGGGVHTAVASLPIRTLELLLNGGGTEQVAPLLAVLALASAVLGAMFVARQRASRSRMARYRPFIPLVLIVGYAIALAVLGTWYAGSGPAYGALKTTFMATIVVLTVTLPLAIMEIDRRRVGLTIVRVLAIVGVIYLLAVDTILPRAFTYLSPQQWPSIVSETRGYWWPAEVRNVADQSIAANPIGCAFLPQGATAPSALPDGQTAYACTRLLSGLSGMDSTGQPVVDWLRREWLTNTPAWTDVYPGFLDLSPEVLGKRLILLDVGNNVVGLDTIQSFMDRVKPEWAK
jgi:hypothetical protein